jgi:hypothetical protein
METKEKLLKDSFEVGLARVKRQMDSFIDTLYFRELRNTGLESFASSVMFPTRDHLEKYLVKKRGYVLIKLGGAFCYQKDFTCVAIHDTCVNYWHDSLSNPVCGFLSFEELVRLPDALNYMERL